jgi:predicted metalloendopeptidase
MWWKPKSFVEFANRAQCFVDQYGSQIDSKTGERVDGQKTLDENIADNAGVRAAYRTFIRTLDKENEPSVSGFETPQQAFFIAYGSVSQSY